MITINNNLYINSHIWEKSFTVILNIVFVIFLRCLYKCVTYY